MRTLVLAAFGLLAAFLFAGIDAPSSARAGTVIAQGQVAAGGAHSCAVLDDGGTACWGANQYGQLGDGTTTTSNVPVDVTGLAGAESLAAGSHFTCAVTTAGAGRCWGRNDSGQLGAVSSSMCGSPATACSQTPIAVSGLSSGVAALAAGARHACALMDGGGVKCWGDNSFGQLGNGSAAMSSMTPVDVLLAEDAVAIAAAALFSCALTASGGVQCWGDNAFGQLGDGTTDDRDTPVQVTGLTSGVVAIGAGGGGSFGHACAALSSGGASCWGNNEFGQLGDDRKTCRAPMVCSTPIAVLDLTEPLAAIAGGSFFTCAMTQAGQAKCWGHNSFGQVGDNFGCGLLCGRPVDVVGLPADVSAIAADGSHACAITVASSIYCWGDNANGQLGDAGECGTPCFAPVAVLLSAAAPGDVDCSGAATSIDAALILQLTARLVGSLDCEEAADVNGDGRIGAIDAALILQLVAGLIDSL